MDKIEYGEITTEKLYRNTWIATTFTTKPIKSKVNMQGRSEAQAISKLKAFLDQDSLTLPVEGDKQK